MEELDLAQKQIDDIGFNEELCNQEQSARLRLEFALHDQEEFWHEKSRLNWHLHGDRNTAFFHKLTKVRNVSKQITMLKRENTILTDPDELEPHIVSYYENLFKGDNACIDDGLVDEVIVPSVSRVDNLMLTNLPSISEVKEVVFSMNTDGAPGPDGFGAYFFQKYWHIIKQDVVGAVIQFFKHGWLLPGFNSNQIVLIPKVQNADRIELFIPIALANFKFKIITKILADRLSEIAPKIISPNQRDFIQGREIGDCICLASEGINLLDRKSFGGNLALKIDIRKAFDTID